MRNFDTFYAIGAPYSSGTSFFSEPQCFKEEITFQTIQVLGKTEEETCFRLVQIIHNEIESASENMKVSVEGITLPSISKARLFRATVQFKYQVAKNTH